MRAPNALAANALLTVAAVSSIIGLAISRTKRGFELKNVAAASAEKRKLQRKVRKRRERGKIEERRREEVGQKPRRLWLPEQI